MPITKVTYGQDEPRKPYFSNWINLFMMAIAGGTVYLLWTKNMMGFWLRGLFWTCILLLVVLAFVRALNLQRTWSRLKDFAFILVGLGLSVVMMQPSIQNYLSNQVGFQVYGLGLIDSNTGALLADNWLLILILVAVLGFVIWLTPKGKGDW